MKTNSLSERAMIVSLNIRLWSGRKLDRNVTDEVNSNHGTKDAGNFNKILIDKDQIGPIKTAANNIREYLWRNTLPWGRNGDKILSATHYFEFMKGLKPIIDEFDYLSDQFVKNYEHHKEKARRNLNGLFNEADYPTGSEIYDKFGVNLSIVPMPDVPDPKDFRIDLPDSVSQDVIESISETISGRHDDATSELIERCDKALNGVTAAITRIHQRKEGQRVKFAQTLMDKVEEIAGLIPKLNYVGDATIAKLGKEMQNMVEDVETLKTNEEARDKYMQRAKKLGDMFFG